MGLILDSSVLIGAERRTQAIGELLRSIRSATVHQTVAIAAITVLELAHGLWRANTPDRAERRRIYLQEVYAAIRVEPFTKEIAERAARIDAESRAALQSFDE